MRTLALALSPGAQVELAPLRQSLPDLAADVSDLAAADVDGDGVLDVIAGARNARDRLYLGRPSGVFEDGSEAMPAVDADTRDLSVGDVDGDGDPDVLVAAVGPSRLYRNDGGQLVDAPGQIPLLSGVTLGGDLGDVDLDGDLDAVLGRDASFGSVDEL